MRLKLRLLHCTQKKKKKKKMSARGNNEVKDLLWKLPVLKSDDFGKMGPAFGVGAGCGVGFGVGLLGGTIFFFGFSSKPLI